VRGEGAGGFTLLEVVVALMIVQVGIIGSLSLMVLASHTVTRAEQVERAVAVAAALADSLSTAAGIDSSEVEEAGLHSVWFGAPSRFEVWVEAESGDTIRLVAGSTVGLRAR
jgi:type II secretory pathway pseudopilin PulG